MPRRQCIFVEASRYRLDVAEVRQARRAAGVTQASVADALELDQSTWSRWERTRTTVELTPELVAALVVLLDARAPGFPTKHLRAA